MTRPSRYTENNSSRDWIDEFCATSTPEEVRGAFRFTIGKYLRRYGKKDDHLQEALKIQDYANRLVEYERSLSKPIIRELYTESTEARMDVVGQNGNTAEHYPADEWIPTNGKKPDLPKGALVDIKFADGCVDIGRSAGFWIWTQDGDPCDITHYRIHQPE